jgi:predicted secreted Zn-dependent protease
MVGKFKARIASTKNKTYTVSGDTLEDIWNDIRKKGLKGSDVVGAADTGVSTPNITKFDEEEDKKAAKKKDEEGWVVTGKPADVKVEVVITLPNLKSDRKLSPKAKKEWQRFVKEVSAHEDEHVEAAMNVAKEIAEELTKMRGAGSGKDKKASIKAAEADFVKKYKAAYGGDKVAKRVQKAHDAFDAKGNTFTLDVNID